MSELNPCPFCGKELLCFGDQLLNNAVVKGYIHPEASEDAFRCPLTRLVFTAEKWNTRAESPELTALREQVKVLREALEGARIFIVDGLEFWCVEQSEPGKQAFGALNGIYRALAQTKPKDGEGC